MEKKKKDMPIITKQKVWEYHTGKSWEGNRRKIWVYTERTILTSELKADIAMKEKMKLRATQRHLRHQARVTTSKEL